MRWREAMRTFIDDDHETDDGAGTGCSPDDVVSIPNTLSAPLQVEYR
jgi:hypothetical protein